MLGDFPFKAEYVLVKSEPLQGRSTWIYQLRALTEVINFVSQSWWLTPAISVLARWRQMYYYGKYEASLGDSVSSRPAWAI